MRNLIPGVSALALSSFLLTSAEPLHSQRAPVARYAMDVETQTGLGAMGSGMGAGMSMMFGGGADREARRVHLRLGSANGPSKGSPKADHFFIPAAKFGKSVPLTGGGQPGSDMPEGFQRPKGRLLLFWGCGAKAGKGQPIIIDFAKVAAGQMPPGLMSVRVPRDPGPQPSNSRTFGEWPNGKNAKPAGKGSSLIGDHRVAANYAPEIKFTLGQDYMPPISARTTSMPGGATGLTWNSVAGATGYHAWLFGMKMDSQGNMGSDMVMWTSASAREFGNGLWDWLPPSTVQRLIGEKLVMPPGQTACTVPAEVKTHASMLMGSLVAYGPEANFAYPPRPADPKAVWAPEWTARVRFRSMTTWMVGMPGMAGASGQEQGRKCSIAAAAMGAC